jgi:hypothetical protein
MIGRLKKEITCKSNGQSDVETDYTRCKEIYTVEGHW